MERCEPPSARRARARRRRRPLDDWQLRDITRVASQLRAAGCHAVKLHGVLVSSGTRERCSMLGMLVGTSGRSMMRLRRRRPSPIGNCVNMNGAPRMRTPSRRSGARSCHAPGGVAA